MFCRALAGLLLAGAACLTADPVVSNVTVAQREGTKLVDIQYDLATDQEVVISVEISGDGGASWTVPAGSMSGSLGAGITSGTGKSILWNGGADWDGGHTHQGRVRVTAAVPAMPPPAGEFSLIPAGTNSGNDPDFGSYSLTVAAFYMAKHEVSKTKWDEVREWGLANGYTDLAAGEAKDQDHPVYFVSWFHVVKWCNARSEKEGRTPCYYLGGSVYRSGSAITTVFCNFDANGYRLPTEIEWEYAARGGARGYRFPFGNEIHHGVANYNSDTMNDYDKGEQRGHHPDYKNPPPPYTNPVGSFPANGYGLNEMIGNVGEWCWDPTLSGTTPGRATRGGSWSSYAESCRTGIRGSTSPGTNNRTDLGFRLCTTAKFE